MTCSMAKCCCSEVVNKQTLGGCHEVQVLSAGPIPYNSDVAIPTESLWASQQKQA